jgi:hypothetical protein
VGQGRASSGAPAKRVQATGARPHPRPCPPARPLTKPNRPRHEDPARCASEDDGFLVTYVHDEVGGTSYLGVWDAATMDDAPLARVALPARVPYGFHAMWAGAGALAAQRAPRAR